MRKISFNLDWLRVIGNGMGFFDFGGAKGEYVDLPNDFIINMERKEDVVSGSASGYFPGGQATYIKDFTSPQEWAGKTVLLDVDGAYMNAEVLLNGEKIGYNPYGYTPFFSDMTAYMKSAGSNELKIITQCRQPNSRWYSGGGLYREVNIWVGDQYYIHPWSTFITTPEVSSDSATVKAEVEVTNATNEPSKVTLLAKVFAPDGAEVASKTASIRLPAKDKSFTELVLSVSSPELWDAENPNLYSIEYTVLVGDKVYDSFTQNFGIRKIEIDAKNGMRVNGKPVKLRGGCIHHDNTLLGACAFPRAEERKIQILKDAGYNAIRTAHNPPSSAMLDVCDRLGMYVLDESFDCWTMGKNGQDYHLYFENWWQRDTRAMVLRDRNHPSVYCWSIGNEIPEMTGVESGGYWSKLQADYVRSLDPTRPITAGIHGIINFAKAGIDLQGKSFFELQGKSTEAPGVFNGVDYWAAQTGPSTDPLDIVGYNYIHPRYALDAAKDPNLVIHGTETHPLTTYDYWQATLANDNVIGDYIWTAYDNLGEAGAGRVIWDRSDPKEAGFMGGYPWLSCYQGDINLDGDRRPQSYFRKIMWGMDRGIHLFTTHPTFTGKPYYGSGWHWPDVKKDWSFGEEFIGKPVQIDAYCDCDEVEFLLNGRSVGKAVPKKLIASITIDYEPGVLEALAIRNGSSEDKVSLVTVGAPAKIVLSPDRSTITADGMDLSFINACVVDADGNQIITSDIELSVTVEGAGTLAGFGSGNPCTEENYGTGKRKTFEGRALICVRSGTAAGNIGIEVKADGLAPVLTTINCEVKI